jgi:hypothetical protein
MKMNNPFQEYNRGYTARERRIRSKYGTLFLLTGIVCIGLVAKVTMIEKDLSKLEKVNTELQSTAIKLNQQIDSLRDESFNASTVNGRYELSLDHLKEVNPKAGKEFEDFYEHETE